MNIIEACGVTVLPGVVYTRARAVHDGLMIDVSPIAAHTGYRLPVAITRAAWAAAVFCTPAELARGFTEAERLAHLLACLNDAVHRAPCHASALQFGMCIERAQNEFSAVLLRCVVWPGDDGELALTVRIPGEE